MKITKVTIRNYRSCVDTKFSPDSFLSVLIGPNGSGKTNILSALKLLPALCAGSARYRDSDRPISSECELRVDFEIDSFSVSYVANINIVTNEKNQDEVVSSVEDWWVPSPSGRRKKIRVPLFFLFDIFTRRYADSNWTSGGRRDYFAKWLKSRGFVSETLSLLERIVAFVSRMSYYSASQFTNPGSAPVSFEVEGESRRRIGFSVTGHKRLLFDIYQEYQNQSETYQEFISLVGSEGIGLIDSIDFEEIQTSSSNVSVMTGGKVVKKEKKNLLVVPRVQIGGNFLSPSQLSEGTFKTLALIFCLVTDRSSVLMIEEPEVCVHHGLLASIVELIKIYSREKQIFISTHSDSVLDRVEIHNVFKVERSAECGTIVANLKRKLGAKEIATLKRYLASEGSLGEYWKHGDLEQI